MANKNIWHIILTLLFIALSIGLLTYTLVNKDISSNSPDIGVSENNLNTITQNAGEVSIAVTPVLNDSEYEFYIELNTHSVELNYDLVALSSLANEKGQIVKPSNWKGDGPEGHHRKGQLFFPLFPRKPKVLNLTISEIGGEDINFKWKL